MALPLCDCPCLALPEALQRYLVLIYPGLVGAVTMVSCSILALTHLLFEFKGECCFLESLGSPQDRKMPRRSGQGHYQNKVAITFLLRGRRRNQNQA